MYQGDPLSEVEVSVENSVIIDGVLKKFTYDNWLARNSKMHYKLRVIISDGITGIDMDAFEGRYEVESIYIGKDVKSIHCAAFSGCENLFTLEVSPENKELHSAGNCVIRTDKKRLIIGCRASKIPTNGSVAQLWSAFYNCKDLEKIVIPEGVTYIGAEAFNGCERLKKIYLPKSLKFIGKDAFLGCQETDAWGNLEPAVELYYSGTFDDWCKIEGSMDVFGSHLHCTDQTI